MRDAKTVRSSNTYQNVFTSPDLTPKERETNKLLHQELKCHKEAGESDLIIRRGKIVSKIVKNSTPMTMDIPTKNQQ